MVVGKKRSRAHGVAGTPVEEARRTAVRARARPWQRTYRKDGSQRRELNRAKKTDGEREEKEDRLTA
jgi:hypothetical protein